MLLQIVGRHFFPLVKIFLAFFCTYYHHTPNTKILVRCDHFCTCHGTLTLDTTCIICILGYKITVSRTNPNLFKNGVSQIYVWEVISIKYDLIRLTITREEKTINLFNVWVFYFVCLAIFCVFCIYTRKKISWFSLK